MTMAILALVVLAQIILFQFIAALANRSIIRQELRSTDGPVPGTVTDHARRAPTVRMALGVVLACLAILPLTGLTGAAVTGRLLIAAVSVISAGAFVVALAKDRKVMRLLAATMPGGSVRRASLERRTLSQWYHPAFEAIPIVIFVATALFLISTPGLVFTGSNGVDPEVAGERSHIFVLLGLQGLLVFGALYRSIRKGVDVDSMAQHIPSLTKRPEASLRLGEQMAGTQLRFFMFAKIAVASLLGAAVVENVLEATGHPAAMMWDALGWGIVGVLMVSFLFYLRRVGRISRQMLQETELTNHNAAGAG
jgi:hypothetical protein